MELDFAVLEREIGPNAVRLARRRKEIWEKRLARLSEMQQDVSIDGQLRWWEGLLNPTSLWS